MSWTYSGEGGEIGVNDGGAGTFDQGNGLHKSGHDGFVDGAINIDDIPSDSDALPSQSGVVAGCNIVGNAAVVRNCQSIVIIRVNTGDGLKQIGGILYGSRHRSDSVLMLGDGNDKVSAGKSNGRLYTNKVVDI